VKAKELQEDMQERWETSDNRLVHGIQNTYDSWTHENETAVAMKLIRSEPWTPHSSDDVPE
jgi:hypothetical protein